MKTTKVNRYRIVAVSLLAGLCLAGTDAQSFTLQEKTVTTTPTMGTRSAPRVNAPVEYKPRGMNELLSVAMKNGYLPPRATSTKPGSACVIDQGPFVTLHVGEKQSSAAGCEFELFAGQQLKPGFTFKRLDAARGMADGDAEVKQTFGGPGPTSNSLRMVFTGSAAATMLGGNTSYATYLIRSVTIQGPAGSCWEAALGAPCP